MQEVRKPGEKNRRIVLRSLNSGRESILGRALLGAGKINGDASRTVSKKHALEDDQLL